MYCLYCCLLLSYCCRIVVARFSDVCLKNQQSRQSGTCLWLSIPPDTHATAIYYGWLDKAVLGLNHVFVCTAQQPASAGRWAGTRGELACYDIIILNIYKVLLYRCFKIINLYYMINDGLIFSQIISKL